MDVKNLENYEVNRMIVRFYNLQTGSSVSSTAERNQLAADSCLKLACGNVTDVKIHIKKWIDENAGCNFAYSFVECMQSFKGASEARAETPVQETQTQTAAPTESAVSASLGILEQAVVSLIAKTQSDKIENEIIGQVKQTIADFIKSEYGAIERKINTIIDGKKVEVTGVQHEKFETVLKFVANNEPVFLTGPAGSGKNVICKQIAEALGLKFYFTNAVTQEYKLTGFTDAMGNYQETQFYKAFKYGGVFMLDEMDASIPEVLVILNAAIANRYFDFPAPIGYVEAHPDFRVIAAGNTTGHGADFEYVGRNQLDGASLDRFAIVKIDYSETIENAVAMGDLEIADFFRDLRQSANKAGVQIIVSYRAIGRFAKMVQLLSIEEALETCIIKGLEKDDVNMITNGLCRVSKYSQALKNLAA